MLEVILAQVFRFISHSLWGRQVTMRSSFAVTGMFLGTIFLVLPWAVVRAGEVALYGLVNDRVQYEGVGYRQDISGWELKVKPASWGVGGRWRHPLPEFGAVQAQYWANAPKYDEENGNTQSKDLKQNGQTRLWVQHALADMRFPLYQSPLEVVAGVQMAWADFKRQQIVYHQMVEPEEPRETLWAAGGHVGFHGAHSGKRFFVDGEILLGHFFWTHNTQSVDGGGIHREGYSYLFRAETGARWGAWKVSVGFFRELLEIHVPGGKRLSTGAAASLPLNKLDVSSPFLGLTYVY